MRDTCQSTVATRVRGGLQVAPRWRGIHHRAVGGLDDDSVDDEPGSGSYGDMELVDVCDEHVAVV